MHIACTTVITPTASDMQLLYYIGGRCCLIFIHHLRLLRSFHTLFSNRLWVFRELASLVYLFFSFLFWATRIFFMSFSGNEPVERSIKEPVVSTQTEKKKNTLCHCFTTNTEKKSLQIWNVLSFPKGSFHFLYMSYIYVNLHKEWIFIETSKLYNHG